MKGIRRKFKPWTPGMWQGVSFDTYLSAPGLNKSTLALLDQCPAKLANRGPDKDSPAMRFGRAAHAWALERKIEFAQKPEGMKLSTKEGKEWAAKQTHEILSFEEGQEVLDAGSAIRSHPIAGPLIKGGRREVTVIADYCGRLIKCRPDLLHPAGHVVDIKTCRNASTRSCQNDIVKYGYHLQAAICWKACALHGITLNKYYLLFIERGSCLINIKPLSAELMQLGQDKLDRLLEKYAECEKSGVWPDYSADGHEFNPPAWAVEEEPELEGLTYATS